MQQFLLLASVHFLALLSPGPDFFLVARSALVSGWRTASGACVGIAVGNAVFIAAAFAGLAVLRADSAWFITVQLAGCGFLLYMGLLFLRHAGRHGMPAPPGSAPMQPRPPRCPWCQAAAQGLLSALLNPKNALFYASLAALLPDAGTAVKLFYAGWMFSVVLLWDLLVAAMIGHPVVLRRFTRALPWLERITGVLLIGLAVSIPMSLGWAWATAAGH
ncbi:LysE family translocator [Bacillus subtilis subsp. subtilis]|nr:LysE family translocator [Bacillus subtilis subsp. subtilis]